MKISNYIAGALLTLGLASCGSDYLNPVDTSTLTADQVANVKKRSVNAPLSGIWLQMVTISGSSQWTYGYMSVMLATDMMSSNIALATQGAYTYDYAFDYRLQSWAKTSSHWTTFYTMVNQANLILADYPDRSNLSDVEKALVGQALAVRGLAYYYLIQLYQDPITTAGAVNTSAPGVPLYYVAGDSKTAAEIEAAKGRNTLGDVYKQIESDLTTAVSLISAANYQRDNKEFIDVHVANGLLARYYLLSQQWQKAADAANAARSGYNMMSETALHDGFLDITNSEWMWGFNHTSETNTVYGSFFSYMSNLAPGYAGLGRGSTLIDKALYDSIPSDDYRKSLFNGANGNSSASRIGARYPYANIKFGNDGNWTMDYVYMRAAEMVLIEAEAYAHLGNNTKAAEVLKVLMASRQPSWNKTSVTVDDVYLQRRIELWGEGFGYFDLKRLGKGINRNYTGNNHLAGYALEVPAHDVAWTYQIPLREIQENSHITESDQNP